MAVRLTRECRAYAGSIRPSVQGRSEQDWACEAAELSKLVEGVGKAFELHDFQQRLERLEAALPQGRQK